MSLALSYAATSHVGLLRTGNEDSGYSGPRLLAVADGMGGHAAGEVASAVAIASLSPLDETEPVPGEELKAALSTAATAANTHLRELVAGDPALDGMGTTLTALLFAGPEMGVLHIGDSRCYLLRDGELSQITHDDTLVQSLVDEGRISEDEAHSHPQRSLITRALDGRDDVDFDLSVRQAAVGDRYLLCTDGLTGPVASRDTLQEALSLADPREAVARLVDLALRGGGPDNVTVVVADVIDGTQGDAALVVGAAADADSAGPTTVVTGGPGAGSARAAVAEAPPRRRRGRLALLVLGVVVLLGAGAFGFVVFLQSQWYVGVEDDQVTVFRGVSGSIAGLELHRAQEPPTGLPAAQVNEGDLARLRSGIQAQDRADAQQIIDRLRPVPTTPGAPR